MSVPYNHKVIEKKWQKVWDDHTKLLPQQTITASQNIMLW